jgi:ribonuclease G
MEGTVEEVRERAVPFQEGEEVLVTIVEPHMYNVDDAVAKIDGYIVSVTGGGRHVGEKRLVRIDEVGRTAAVATLVANGNGPSTEDADADAAPEGEDGVESAARRRGRRGGRRRSRAKTDVTAGTTADDD